MYRAGLIESWGRGILKIIESCKKAGNKPPVFDVKPSEISLTFEAKQVNPAIEVENPAIEAENPAIEAENLTIHELIEQLPCKITTKQNIQAMYDAFKSTEIFGRTDIAGACGISYSLAGDIIEFLKEHELIETVKGFGKGKYRFIRR